MSYILDFNKLELGDIVISSGESLGAKAIKIATMSKDTHVMLYVGHTFIHAVPQGGVYSKNPQRELFSSENHVKVLRLKNKISSSKLSAICEYARALTGTLYSIKEAVLTKKYNNSHAEAQTNMQFCSRLIAQAYGSQCIDLVSNSNYCSPKQIGESPLLREVEHVVKKASQAEISFSKTIDPTAENQRVTYCWLNKARIIAAGLNYEIQSLNDVTKFIVFYPNKDIAICEFIVISGYLEQYKRDLELNPFRYSLDKFLMYFSNENINLVDAVVGELDKEFGLIEHMSKNYFVYQYMYKENNLTYFKLHAELYFNILLQIKDRLVVLHEVSKNKSCNELQKKIFYLIDIIDKTLL